MERAAARNEVIEGRAGGEDRTAGGKTLVHILAERKAQSMYTDLMASGGVGYNQIAKEVLFFLPRDFLEVYEELWQQGLAGKDDGGAGARGESQAETGRVGKASTRNVPGGMQISSGGAKRKSYKKYWVIADEEALALKDKVDKRLRGLTREARQELQEIRSRRAGAEGSTGGTVQVKPRCAGCGRILEAGWKFCPNDGHRVDSE